MRAEAHGGHALLADGSDDQLSPFAIGQRFTRHRIDDLRDEIILPDVQSLALEALHRHAGTDALGQTVNVQRADVQQSLDLAAHALRPGFGAKDADAELEVGHIDLLIADGFAHHQRIGRRAGDSGRSKILHQHQLALGVARGDRHNGRPDTLHAVMKAQPPGEQTVAIGHLHGIFFRHTRAAQTSCHAFRPHLQIVGGISRHNRLAGGAGRSMDADDFLPGRGEGAKGVIVAQITLIHKGKQS